jgi:hypothetical protein
MTDQGSSNSKPPIHTKQINLATQIFPGIGKENTENFINLFPTINQVIKHFDLGPHLADPDNTKIKRRTDESVATNQTRDQLVSLFYNSHRKKEKEKHRMSFHANFKTQVIDIYLAQGQTSKIPQMIIAGLNPSGRQQAKLHNTDNDNEEVTIDKTSAVASTFIENDFLDTHPIFAPTAVGEASITPATMEERLDEVGQTDNLETYISQMNSRDAATNSRFESQTRHLISLFTTVIANVPATIMLLVNDYQFTNAWNALLKHWIVDNDDSNVILKLELNLLTCTFNAMKHKDFIEYYNALHTQYSLYLYKVWYQHFSFEQIKEMVDTMTDAAIIFKHHTILTANNLTIPELVCEERRIIQLYNGVKGSHLQPALALFKSLHPSSNHNNIVDLKRELTKADTDLSQSRKSATIQYIPTGYTIGQISDEMKCKMCMLLKEKFAFSNLKGHPTGTPCTDANIDIITKYFTNNPHIPSSGKKPYNISDVGWGHNPKQQEKTFRGDTRGPNPNQPQQNPRSQPLPVGFDESRNCINCYRSWKAEGKDSVHRGSVWDKHASHNCREGIKYQAHHSQQIDRDSTRSQSHSLREGNDQSQRHPYPDANDQRQDVKSRGRTIFREPPGSRDYDARGPIGGYAHNTSSGKRSRSRSQPDTYSPPRQDLVSSPEEESYHFRRRSESREGNYERKRRGDKTH